MIWTEVLAVEKNFEWKLKSYIENVSFLLNLFELFIINYDRILLFQSDVYFVSDFCQGSVSATTYLTRSPTNPHPLHYVITTDDFLAQWECGE